MRDRIEAILTATFKPEFLNRLDETVIFHRLSREDISRIVDLQVERSPSRVAERGIEIELTDDARTLLGNLGYDPTYGARPLKRVIQKQLVDKLALKLLEGEFSEGDASGWTPRAASSVFGPAPQRGRERRVARAPASSRRRTGQREAAAPARSGPPREGRVR